MVAPGRLMERIDAEFSAAEARWNKVRCKEVQLYHDRQKRLERFEETTNALRELWEPRLQTLAKRFGKNMDAQPIEQRGRRAVCMDFGAQVARITLRFAAVPDANVEKIFVSYDVEVLPILMKFDSHRELELPLGSIDHEKLAEWLDNRIVDFVHIYLAVHENEHYLKNQMVDDPVAGVRFPRFAAAATLEVGGKTLYFIDESTLHSFQQQNSKYIIQSEITMQQYPAAQP